MGNDNRAEKSRQEPRLTASEAELRALSADQKKDSFSSRIIPLLGPLKGYIKRRLRVAYAAGEIRTPLYTSDDIVEEVVLKAYEQFHNKPNDLTLNEWLHRLANEVLERYLRERKSVDARRRSLEELRGRELDTLDELKEVTADAEAEPWLAEDLDDAEYNIPEIRAPQETDTPEKELERKEEVAAVVRALARVPVMERIVFELFRVEGLPEEAVARIAGIAAEDVPRIAERVRRQILQELGSTIQQKAS